LGRDPTASYQRWIRREPDVDEDRMREFRDRIALEMLAKFTESERTTARVIAALHSLGPEAVLEHTRLLEAMEEE
jgi:hypothetical protein